MCPSNWVCGVCVCLSFLLLLSLLDWFRLVQSSCFHHKRISNCERFMLTHTHTHMTYANVWSTNKGQLINKNPKYGKNWNRFASIPLAFSVSTRSLAHPSPYVLWACAYRPLFVLFDDFIYTIYGLISFLAISNQYALRFSVNFAFLFVAIFGVCHALLLRLLLFCLHIICYVSCVCVCVLFYWLGIKDGPLYVYILFIK